MFEGATADDRAIMRKFTQDLQNDANSMQYYTTESLGTSQELTPEGFLLCKNVPVARTGSQLYARGEIPVPAGADGLIHITRDEGEVFHPITMASYQGKPVVDEHPFDGKVTPMTWKERSVGVVLNPRRGDGMQFDNAFTYADLLITDKDAIEAVRNGKRQVSVGYDAEYETLGPGRGRQHNIIVNHVALVEKGRCGPRCAIGDSAMANRLTAFKDRIRRAVRTRDEAGVLNAVAELSKDPDLLGEVLSGDEAFDAGSFSGGDEPRHVTINVHGAGAQAAPGMRPSGDAPEGDPKGGGMPAAPAAPPGGGDLAAQVQALMARMDQIEQVLAALAEGEEQEPWHGEGEGGGEEGGAGYEPSPDNNNNGDQATVDSAQRVRATVGDSTSMRDGFQQMLSQAEILVPGIAFPTFDSAMPAKGTFDSMCAFKRKTLDAAKSTDRGKSVLEQVVGGRLPKSFNDRSVTCDHVGMVFNAASALVAQDNRGRAHSTRIGPGGQPNTFGKAPPSPAEINKRNSEYFQTH